MENIEVIKQMLSDLLQKTTEKKIDWKVINTNTVRWTKIRNAANQIVTLQKQPSPNPVLVENYVITIQSQNPPGVVVQLNTSIETGLKDLLKKLFIEVTKEAARTEEEKKIEIIKNLLKDI
jgi:hypothetical protein